MTPIKQGVLNEKMPSFLQICEGAEASEDPVQFLKDAYTRDKRVTNILGYCANPSWKIPLPDGTPPYRPADYPDASLAEMGVLHQHEKIKGLFNTNMKSFKREELWVSWLESMYDKEALIMNMIKDQTLHVLYPKITKQVIAAALGWPIPDFIALCEKYKVPA